MVQTIGLAYDDYRSRPPMLQITPEEWTKDGACLQTKPDEFFPDKGDQRGAARAKTVCRGCDVRDQCLAYALRNHERWGVWGGLSERERRKLELQEGAA